MTNYKPDFDGDLDKYDLMPPPDLGKKAKSTRQKIQIIEPFEHEIDYYRDRNKFNENKKSITIRVRPKFLKSMLEDVREINRERGEKLNSGQTQALLVDIGLGHLYSLKYLEPLLAIEKYLLHSTAAGNSSEIIEHYEDAMMPFKFSNITIGDLNYRIVMDKKVIGSVGHYASIIRLPTTTVIILCLIHGADAYIEANAAQHRCRPRNLNSLAREVENLDRWVKRQLARLFFEYDDYTFDLTTGTAQFKYLFNTKQNFTFKGQFCALCDFCSEFEKNNDKSVSGDIYE